MLDEKYETERTRASRRHKDWSKAVRKKKISDSYGVFSSEGSHWYDNLHEYSKGKIHCSCPMCRAKTKNKGKRRKGSWSPSYNPTMAEKKCNASMESQMVEYDEVENGESICSD